MQGARFSRSEAVLSGYKCLGEPTARKTDKLKILPI